MTARWEADKGAIDKVRKLKEQLRPPYQVQEAQRQGDLKKRAAQI